MFHRQLTLVFLFLITPVLNPDPAWGNSLSGNFPKYFAQLDRGLSKQDLREIKVGYTLFAKPWVFAGSSTKRRDGLGPHFSATSCMTCHPALGRGAPPGILHKNDPALIFITADPVLKDLYNNEINTQAHPTLKSEGRLSKISSQGKFQQIQYGLNGKALAVSPRIAPHVAGLGYIDAISDQDILANQKNGGLANMVNGRIGRFGWKASQPTIAYQTATAFIQDMGITSFLKPNENCAVQDYDCHQLLTGADEEGTEIRKDHFFMVVKMLQSISPPKRLAKHPAGEKVFKQIGCQNCHRKEYQTSRGDIQPFSDFLLHDMGAALADNSNDPFARLWKTPPLWGLGSQRLANGHTRLLHDGRAANIEEAILWHAGEALAVRKAFEMLEFSEKQDLLDFLKTL